MKQWPKGKKEEQTSQMVLFSSNVSLKGARKTNKQMCICISVMQEYVYGVDFDPN